MEVGGIRADGGQGVSAPLSEAGRLRAVLVKHPRDAFRDERTIAAEWQDLNFTAPADLPRAVAEHDRFVELLRSAGAAVHFLPADGATTLDSIYARDASVLCGRGLILCRMGKRQRESEPDAQRRALASLRIALPIAGQIGAPGRLEGGDLVWFDERTVAIGRGYRTNADGIGQFRRLAAGAEEHALQVVEVPLPHWRGESDVMHLMSLISPVDRDLAVVYSRLLPVPFREWLLERGMRLIEVPDEEFETMGTNVLALAPRTCVMLAGNPRTRAALERAGAQVLVYEGNEISVKGAGGPTCLTRPLVRDPL
jgi:N-dimethylarginine dimethylaminohydrolase